MNALLVASRSPEPNQGGWSPIGRLQFDDGVYRFGCVPRYLAHDVWKLFQSCEPDLIQVFVHRVNTDAPLQQRLLCRMHACWPDGFQPCSSEEFHPIPEGVSAHSVA